MFKTKIKGYISYNFNLSIRFASNNIYQFLLIFVFIFTSILPIYASFDDKDFLNNNMSSSTINDVDLNKKEINNYNKDKINLLPVENIEYSPLKYYSNKNVKFINHLFPVDKLTSSGNIIVIKNNNFNKYKLTKKSSKNTFYKGYCTWYVAQNKNVDWFGNARDWITNARLKGHKISYEPILGSIVVFDGGPYMLGHVGVVTSIDSNSFVISEMNYYGLGKENSRKIYKNNVNIKGFIIVN